MEAYFFEKISANNINGYISALYFCFKGNFSWEFTYASLTALKITKTSQETRNLFRADFLFIFQALQVLSCNIRGFLSLRLESSISRSIRHFFLSEFFFFFEFGKLLPKIQEKYKARKFHFRKYKKVQFPKMYENIRKFFRLGFSRKNFEVWDWKVR